MTGYTLTGPADPPGPVGQAIGSYLAEIANRLPGPARARRDILAELNAGLAEAIDAHRSAGLNPARATRAAIAEFGGPEQVADGFRPELAAAQARRTARREVRASQAERSAGQSNEAEPDQKDWVTLRLQLRISPDQMETCRAAAGKANLSIEAWTVLALDHAARNELGATRTEQVRQQ